jgi:hypothetical protein
MIKEGGGAKIKKEKRKKKTTFASEHNYSIKINFILKEQISIKATVKSCPTECTFLYLVLTCYMKYVGIKLTNAIAFHDLLYF